MKRLIILSLCLLTQPAWAESDSPAWFQALDQDKNGVIGLDELHHARYQRFARVDQNRDGKLTPRELRRDRGWLRRFSWYDADRDGRISIEEYELKGNERFAMLDIDGDGRVTLREVNAVLKATRDTDRPATAG